MKWSIDEAPSQKGRLAVVTGSSGGVGYDTARLLASRGADVIVAARNIEKGQAAASRIGGSTRFERLDLADLSSIAAFARRQADTGRPLDLLINNAGLAATPQRLLTRDGFEMQFGVNFLGHFALTGLLLPLLKKGSRPRVVTVSSNAADAAKIDFDDLMSERYGPVRAYGQSKLADLILALELQRRSDVNGWGISSLAVHPGLAMTELTKARPGQPTHRLSPLIERIRPFLGQTAAAGALIPVYAATAKGAVPGEYYVPDGFAQGKGGPTPAKINPVAKDPKIVARLWAEAERLTKVAFETP